MQGRSFADRQRPPHRSWPIAAPGPTGPRCHALCRQIASASSLPPVFGHVQFLKRNVADRLFPPLPVVKMPPFGLKDGKPFRFYGPTEQIAVPALDAGATRIIRERAR